MTTPSPDAGSTRRQLLRTGAIGAAAAAFLAACGTDNKSKAGLSGVVPSTTSVQPTVPVKAPSEAELTMDTTVLRTAVSLELVVAAAYTSYGPKLSDGDWKAAAARFSDDHTEQAKSFNSEIDEAKHRIDAPNAFVQENTIDPLADLLTTDAAILDLFTGLESMLTATYLAAVGTNTKADARGEFAAVAGASARRVALMGSSGAGSAPSSALYPPTDLVTNAAYQPVDAPKADPGN